MLDEVCKLGKIENNNHLPNVPKLYVFDLDKGEKMPNTVLLRNLPQHGSVFLIETDDGVIGAE